jgi:hypothetical protein
MKTHSQNSDDRYEIIIKKFGKNDPVEIDVMGDDETQEVLRLIGRLNLRSAYAS